jgi:hypothetical protein
MGGHIPIIECVGPKQVKNIDIFIGPLIDELKILLQKISNTYIQF